MRRVLIAFEPPDGGVAENVAQLALNLSAHGWDPVVAGPAESNVYPRLEAAGVPVHRLSLSRGMSWPWREARALRELLKLLDTDPRFDLVHAHSSKAGALARIAARRRRIPTVYSPHCFAFLSDVSGAKRTFAIAVERLLGHYTAGIICACEDERQQALRARIASPDRLFRVYYGVEGCPDEVDVAESVDELRDGNGTVGAVAVLRRQKRLDTLIDATPAILAQAPDARVVIVGNGPERAALEAHAAELGLDRDPRFRMLPFSGPSRRYLAGLDLFVLPSEWEALPIGVLEAMACGVPQIASDVGGTAEAVEDGQTGVLVKPEGPAIAQAVLDLLRDPDRRASMAKASRAHQLERFTVERMVADSAAVFDAVTG